MGNPLLDRIGKLRGEVLVGLLPILLLLTIQLQGQPRGQEQPAQEHQDATPSGMDPQFLLL